MKKQLLLILAQVTFCLTAYAQIEMNSSGKVGIGISPSSLYGLRLSGGLDVTGGMNVNGNLDVTSGSLDVGRIDFSYLVGDFESNIVSFYSTFSHLRLQGEYVPTNGIILTCPSNGVLKVDGSIVTMSDERLKRDKKKIENASEVLSKISGQTYYFKSDEELANIDLGGRKKYGMDTTYVGDSFRVVDASKHKFSLPSTQQCGFMAQEVMKVLPDLVHYDAASGTYAIDYTGFIPLLVESNKELMAKQQVYEDRLDLLEKELKKLSRKKKRNTARSADEDIDDIYETAGIKLFQNNPNPFSSETEIRFNITEDVREAYLFIYNLKGEQIKTVNITSRGESSVTIQAGELMAGMYLYTLVVDGQEVGTRKMILTD